ncbi:MAG TPA: TRAP transporter substrate-binding protein DctP, partial [Saprospiraceae bacterium]|nr:TRAP transporter substrate-binding protein DctP [Saprospiraceae bacterium]
MDRRAAGLKEWTGKLPAWLLILILSTSWSCGKISGVRMLYLAHANTTTHPIHKGLLYLKQVLEERSGGKMTVKVFADGQLGSEREVLELLQIGSVAMTKVSAAVMANFAP